MRRILRALGLVATVAVLLAGVAAGSVYWQARSMVAEFQAGTKREIVERARPELQVDPRRFAAAAPQPDARTILLLGSDRRYGESIRHSDSIVLVRLDPARERAALLSVPRDLFVTIPGHGRDRINMAYRLGGPALTIRTLRETLGVRIDHFFDLDFGGFTRLIDAMGGVYVPLAQRYFNRNIGTPGTNYADIDLRPGYQRLSGNDALAFARYRHTDSDRFRAARQQVVLVATARQVLGTRAYDFFRVRDLLDAFAELATSDVDDVGELWDLVGAARAGRAGIERHLLPTRDVVIGGAQYVESSPEGIRSAVRRWLGKAQPSSSSASSSSPAPVRLRPDDGGRPLLAATGQWVPCTPSALPDGFRWDEARAYRLGGKPTAALTATRGSGRALLWTWTRWPDAPALATATRTVTRDGREYRLTVEGGRVRQVAWRIGEWRVWLTNTLRNEVSGRKMLELAKTCYQRDESR